MHIGLIYAQTTSEWSGDAVHRTWNSPRCSIVRHMCLHLVVMNRVDQLVSVTLGCCTVINWLAATISVCVAYVVGLSMSWRQCSTLWYCV